MPIVFWWVVACGNMFPHQLFLLGSSFTIEIAFTCAFNLYLIVKPLRA